MKKYIIFAAAALMTVTGCKDFLEQAPLTSQSDELTLSTIDGINKSVGGVYAPLATASWYGCDFIVCNEMKTGNGKKSLTKDSGRLIKDYQINYSATSTYGGLWSAAYYVINAASVIIDKLDTNPGLADKQTIGNYRAECRFLRALAHFDLVRTFAQPYGYTPDASHPGVPVILHQDVSAKPSRNTVAEVYKWIIDDLTEAEKEIDPEYRRKGTDPASSVSIWAIKALLSRVYLYCGKYQECADYATQVIEGPYTMWTPNDIIRKDETSVYFDDANTDGEVIFEVYGKNTNTYDAYRDAASYYTTPAGYGDAAACADLMDIYDATDVRGYLFIEGEGDQMGDYWTAKYYGKGDGTPDSNNTFVIRLSEMYLNRAEAIYYGAESSSTVGADLATITTNRGAGSAEASITGILLERRKEFAWEGQYWFDLARSGNAMKRVQVEPGVPTEIPYPDYRWAMPIPHREITANPNLAQNEGY